MERVVFIYLEMIKVQKILLPHTGKCRAKEGKLEGSLLVTFLIYYLIVKILA